jgi:hypothetical protein
MFSGFLTEACKAAILEDKQKIDDLILVNKHLVEDINILSNKNEELTKEIERLNNVIKEDNKRFNLW